MLVPTCVGGARGNAGATLRGRVPVNLNYTANNETIASCAKQCNLQTVVTSKAFLERFPKMEIPGKTLLLEDVLAGPKFSEKLVSLFYAWALPHRMLKRALGARPSTADSLSTEIGRASCR